MAGFWEKNKEKYTAVQFFFEYLDILFLKVSESTSKTKLCSAISFKVVEILGEL